MADHRSLPGDLPVPLDDGAADHLIDAQVPVVRLASSFGGEVDLAEATVSGLTVVYVYPRTGVPGQPLPEGWDAIPGARGCTPQSCAFRDRVEELGALGAGVIGISAQSAGEQREFAAREHIPYPLLSDVRLALAESMRLPTFVAGGMRLYRRLTFVAEQGLIAKVFYPVFPPDRNAGDVLKWLQERGEPGG